MKDSKKIAPLGPCDYGVVLGFGGGHNDVILLPNAEQENLYIANRVALLRSGLPPEERVKVGLAISSGDIDGVIKIWNKHNKVGCTIRRLSQSKMIVKHEWVDHHIDLASCSQRACSPCGEMEEHEVAQTTKAK